MFSFLIECVLINVVLNSQKLKRIRHQKKDTRFEEAKKHKPIRHGGILQDISF